MIIPTLKSLRVFGKRYSISVTQWGMKIALVLLFSPRFQESCLKYKFAKTKKMASCPFYHNPLESNV